MGKLVYWIIGLTIFLAGILAAIMFLKSGVLEFNTTSEAPPTKTTKEVKESQASGYQAVFLVNDQVYFGKLTGYGTSSTPTLREVYYLRLSAALQESAPLNASSRIKAGAASAPVPSSEMVLIKLGNEMHGPIDEIKFNSAQILFVEDLRGDSKIVQAIKDYQAKNK